MSSSTPPDLIDAHALPASPTPVGSPGVEPRRPARLSFLETRAAWAAARAHNAMRRRGVLTTVSGVTFIITLLVLIAVPRAATTAARDAAPRPGEKVDTAPFLAAAAAATRALAAADSALAQKRAAAARAAVVAAQPVRPAPGTLSLAELARRDSLSSALASVNRLLARAQTSPLPSSYRALAEAPELRDDARVRVLLDSLTEVEREREAFGVVGGVDPIYVSLTARATAIGRAIQAVGERRRAELEQEVAAAPAPSTDPAGSPPTVALRPGVPADSAGGGAPPGGVAQPAPAPVRAPVVRVDSTMELAARASAQGTLDAATQRLAVARQRNQVVDQRYKEALAQANLEAPPVAMLIAAAMLAVVVGFGAALAIEVKRPRVADGREAERMARTRVLAVIHPELVSPERVRRQVDVEVPDAIDPSAESYRMLYLSLSATGAAMNFVTVTGDEPVIVATVAANLAAMAALDSRSALIVDAELTQGSVSALLGVGLRAGLNDVVRSGVPLQETIVSVVVGRDSTLDVVPAGPTASGGATIDDRTADVLRHEIARLARRYDLIVMTQSAERSESAGRSLLVAPDVIVCARAGHTPLSGVAREIVRLRNAGALVRGIVVWDADLPQLSNTHEHRVAASARTGSSV
jgi:Mrp family chromosome partitioning ATPase